MAVSISGLHALSCHCGKVRVTGTCAVEKAM